MAVAVAVAVGVGAESVGGIRNHPTDITQRRADAPMSAARLVPSTDSARANCGGD